MQPTASPCQTSTQQYSELQTSLICFCTDATNGDLKIAAVDG